MLPEKGKHANATENRRFVWSELVWPLVLELNEVAFTPEQYRAKRDQLCAAKNVTKALISRGMASLLQKGIIIKEENIYAIHYKLIPYMRLKAECGYGTAIYEVKTR